MRRGLGAVSFVVLLAGGAARAQVTSPSAPSVESARALIVHAIQLQQSGHDDEAIRAYRQFLLQEPDNFVAHANLGAALAHQGQYAKAISEYQDALKIQPGNPKVEINLALAHYKALELNQAAKELLPLHSEAPEDLRIALLLGDCYFRLGKYQQVVSLLEPMEPKNSNNLALLYLLGSSLIRDGQVEKGKVLVSRVMGEGAPALAHLLLGAAEAESYNTTGALSQLSLAIKLDPKLPLAHYLYGKELLLDGGRRSEVMKSFSEELSIDPNEFGPNLYLGVLLNQGHEFKQALPYLQRAVEVRPGDAVGTLQIAVAQIGMKRFEQARETLEALVKTRPTYLAAHVSLATIYYRLHMMQAGDKEQAIVRKLSAEAEARTQAEGEPHPAPKTANGPAGIADNSPP